MAVREWLPATARSAAIDHKLKAGEPLFRLGDKTWAYVRSLQAAFAWRGLIARDAKLCCMLPGPAKRSLRLRYFLPQYHCDAIANTDAIVRIYPKREVLAAFEKTRKLLGLSLKRLLSK